MLKILFVNLSALKFTTDTPEREPLGGSESALCYLARELARRGHTISVLANLPAGFDGNPVKGIKHYPVTVLTNPAFFAETVYDFVIVSNAPIACAPIKNLSPSSKIIFWTHALPDQPAMQPLFLPQTKKSIDAVLCVSDWQRTQIEKIFGTFTNTHVIGNGIAPAFENLFASPQELLAAKQNRAAYTAMPYRGLSVLVRAMQGFDRPTKLDVFSSMRVYQGRDDEYEALFDEASRHDAISCHGSVTQGELARRLSQCAFLFYPSIYAETFCITAMEAIAAGMKVVTTRVGALPQTTQGFADLVPVASSDGDKLAADFRIAMRSAVDDFIGNPDAWAQQRFEEMRHINQTCNWNMRAGEWEKFLSSPWDSLS